MQRGKGKTIWGMVIRNSINNGTLFKSRDEIFIRGEGCNTLGVWLPHLHCISWTWASCIHSWTYITWNMISKHCNMLYISCVLFLLWNVKCATLKCNMCHSLSETRLVNTMQQDHETYETWPWNKSNPSLVLPCFNACDAWFLCDQCMVWLIILLRTLVILRMPFGTLLMLIILPN